MYNLFSLYDVLMIIQSFKGCEASDIVASKIDNAIAQYLFECDDVLTYTYSVDVNTRGCSLGVHISGTFEFADGVILYVGNAITEKYCNANYLERCVRLHNRDFYKICEDGFLTILMNKAYEEMNYMVWNTDYEAYMNCEHITRKSSEESNLYFYCSLTGEKCNKDCTERVIT